MPTRQRDEIQETSLPGALDQDSNTEPPEYEERLLTVTPQCAVLDTVLEPPQIVGTITLI